MATIQKFELKMSNNPSCKYCSFYPPMSSNTFCRQNIGMVCIRILRGGKGYPYWVRTEVNHDS